MNQGQADSPVKFLVRAGGCRLYFSPTEVMWTFNPATRSWSKAGFDSTDLHGRGLNDSESEKTNSSSAVRLLFLGANPCPVLTGLDEQPGKVNYMLGNNPRQWRTGLTMFGKVRYERLYSTKRGDGRD